jgi:hypothetical protein
LSNLIRLCQRSTRLEIQNLSDTITYKDVVIATHTFFKPKLDQKPTQIGKCNVSVGAAPQDTSQQFF